MSCTDPTHYDAHACRCVLDVCFCMSCILYTMYTMYAYPTPTTTTTTEMPVGKVGVHLLSTGTSITILGTAMLTYWVCGFFGASLTGAAAIDTGNFLQDDLGNPTAQGILNMFNVGMWCCVGMYYCVAPTLYASHTCTCNLAHLTVYLILSLPPFEFGTRHAVDSFIMRYGMGVFSCY